MRDQVFISYSHRDNRLMGELLTHLKPCVSSGAITVWSDKQIAPGVKWLDEIRAALSKTRVAVLLVSPDFLASDFIHEHELGPVLKAVEAEGLKILWVQLRACAYKDTPLKDYQAVVSPPDKPLAEMKADRAQAWVRLCEEIKNVVSPLTGSPAADGATAVEPAVDAMEPQLGRGLRILSEPVRGEPLRLGLEALGTLLTRKEVREAVVAFSIRFRDASHQIEILSSYKDLHDLLHQLPRTCCEPIAQEAKRFPDDETARENLRCYAQRLQEALDDLDQLVGRGAFVGDEPERVGRGLAAARQALDQALCLLDADQLRQTLWNLNRVMALLPKITVRLNDAARALNLPELVATMETVCRKLRELGLLPEQVDPFEEGVVALERLARSLITLVDNHDRWQSVEEELGRIEGDLARSLDELESSWPQLKLQMEPLCGSCTESWAVGLQTDGAKLEITLKNRDLVKIRQSFQSYRWQAGRRFHRIDGNLKDQCHELRDAAKPLAMVLRMLG
jgi:hypothetical protein